MYIFLGLAKTVIYSSRIMAPLFLGFATLRVTSGDDNFFETWPAPAVAVAVAVAAFMTQIKVKRVAQQRKERERAGDWRAHEVLMKNAQHLPNEIITEPLSGP